jgi:hypothetical protein
MTENIENPTPLSEKIDTEIVNGRDKKGRFVNGGKPGPGRPPGARNQLSEAFIEDVLAVWREHGIEMLSSLRTEKPGELIRAVASIVARAGAPMNVALPKVNDPADALAAASAVLDAIAAGHLTEAEARVLSSCVEVWSKAYEAVRLEARVSELEARLKDRR